MNILESVFKLKDNNTSIKTELLAGLTTFFTMSYMFIVLPKLLSLTGLNFSSCIIATSLSVFIASVLMALIANKPYAAAPFIGDCAFIVYSVVLTMGFDIHTALAAVFVSGSILFMLTLFNIRIFIINQIPNSLKLAFCLGLGLYFIFISLKDVGIISLINPKLYSASIETNILHCILSIICFILIIALTKKGVKTAIILSVVIITLLGIIIGDVKLPSKFISLSYNLDFYNGFLDFKGLINKDFISAFILIFVLANIDTAGSLMGLGYKDGSYSDNSSSQNLKKPMIADSIANLISPLTGTTTTGAFVDSMTGIASGGRTGLTAITVGILFLLGLIFAPIITIIPSYAYAPVLMYVGVLLTSNFSKIDFSDISEYSIIIITISLMIFTNNIGFGFVAGVFLYPIIKLLCGQKSKTNITQWVMCIAALLFFIIYPY